MKSTILSVIIFILLFAGAGYLLRDQNVPVLSMLGQDISTKILGEKLPVVENTVYSPENEIQSSTETETETETETILEVQIEGSSNDYNQLDSLVELAEQAGSQNREVDNQSDEFVTSFVTKSLVDLGFEQIANNPSSDSVLEPLTNIEFNSLNKFIKDDNGCYIFLDMFLKLCDYEYNPAYRTKQPVKYTYLGSYNSEYYFDVYHNPVSTYILVLNQDSGLTYRLGESFAHIGDILITSLNGAEGERNGLRIHDLSKNSLISTIYFDLLGVYVVSENIVLEINRYGLWEAKISDLRLALEKSELEADKNINYYIVDQKASSFFSNNVEIETNEIYSYFSNIVEPEESDDVKEPGVKEISFRDYGESATFLDRNDNLELTYISTQDENLFGLIIDTSDYSKDNLARLLNVKGLGVLNTIIHPKSGNQLTLRFDESKLTALGFDKV